MTTFLSHAQANILILYTALFIAYYVVVTVAHFFKAWVALKLGDSTPVELGFLSWNPVDHVDFIGMACFFAVGLGWGRNVPINSLNIHGRYRTAKILFANLSDIIAYISIGTVAILALVVLFGSNTLVSFNLAFNGVLSYHKLHSLYPSYSSVHIAVGFIAICLVYLSVTLGALQFIINCFHLFIQHYMTRYGMTEAGGLLFWIMPLFVMILLTGPLRVFIMCTIFFMSTLITQLVGLF